MSVKYSFILPAYKSAFLQKSIESILAQSYMDFELIIVDDDSPENLVSIVNTFHDNRLAYFRNKFNIGGGDLVRQWNKCLLLAHGDYVILASDDDVYDKDYLLHLNRLTAKYPTVNIFRPLVRQIDEEGNVRYEETKTSEQIISKSSYIESLLNHSWCSGIPQYIFKRSALVEIGGFVDFPLAWFSDDATVLLLAENGMAVSDRMLFSLRFSGLNISSRLDSKETLLKKIDAANQYFEFINRNLTSGLIGSEIRRIRQITYFALFGSGRKYFFQAMLRMLTVSKKLFPIPWKLRLVFRHLILEIKLFGRRVLHR